MPYPHPFLRLVLGGGLYGDTEQWTFSMSLSDGSVSIGAPETVLTGIIEAADDFITTPNAFSAGADLRWLKLNRIGTDGRYTEQTTVRYDFPGPVYPAGQVASYLPAQVALCVTLRTAINRGRAHSGRFYAPIPGQTVGSNGLLEPSSQQLYVNAATNLISSINDTLATWDANDPPRVVVMSDAGEGAMQTVTHVSVGAVLDTIRSRRSSLPENYLDGPSVDL